MPRITAIEIEFMDRTQAIEAHKILMRLGIAHEGNTTENLHGFESFVYTLTARPQNQEEYQKIISAINPE